MFKNIGGKIKIVAIVTCIFGMLVSWIAGIILMTEGDIMVLWGFLVAILGSAFSWVGTFFTYGLGQLIENSDKLVAGQSILVTRAQADAKTTRSETKVKAVEAEELSAKEETEVYTYTPIKNEGGDRVKPSTRNLNLETEVMSIMNFWRALGKINQKELDTFVEKGGMKEIKARADRLGGNLDLEGALLDILNRWRAEGRIS